MLKKLMPNLRITTRKLNVWSPVHLFGSALLGFLLGFTASFLLGASYEMAQSYMVREGTDQVKGLSNLEKLLFASNRESDLVDGGLNLVGAMAGAYIRHAIGLGGFY